ncbi:MAG: hypothetical protein WCO60_02120 [Verrucomicrobiota bacterium]
MRLIIGCIALAIIAAIFPSGLELIPIFGFLFLITLPWIWKSKLAWIGIPLGIIGIILHVNGYKLAGSPQITRSKPLENSRRVIALEPPARIIFSNGESTSIEGIHILQAVNLQTDWNFNLVRILDNRSSNPSFEVSITGNGKRANFLQRNRYFCGNTFFPTLFPSRLPSHSVKDVGEILVEAELAIPTTDDLVEESYRNRLLEVFDHTVPSVGYAKNWINYYPLGGIQKHDSAAIALGRSLIAPDSMKFVAGAYLLIAAQDTDFYPEIKKEILRRKARNLVGYDQIAQARSVDLDGILAWIDVKEARKQFLPLKFTPTATDTGTNCITKGAHLFAALGDIAAVDSALQLIDDPSIPEDSRSYLTKDLLAMFRGPTELPKFRKWYQSVRSRLKSGRGQLGDCALWLDDGLPFDEAYFESMAPYMDSNPPPK